MCVCVCVCLLVLDAWLHARAHDKEKSDGPLGLRTQTSMCVYACMYVCMYVCMHACMCILVFTNECMWVGRWKGRCV